MYIRPLFFIALVLLSANVGCEIETPTQTKASPSAVASILKFDASNTGTIRGQVTWTGPLPESTTTVTRRIAFNSSLYKNPVTWSTQHLPTVDANTKGVADTLIFLRGIDIDRARPWDHGTPRIEVDGDRIMILQDKQRSGFGITRVGAAVEIVNIDSRYHNLHGSGAAFFGLPMFKPNVVQRKTFDKAGLIDLCCAAGYYWLHAHLFVVEHPYYVRTDRMGRFELGQVPAGEYDLVCWMPNWRIERAERDPETGHVVRLFHKPAVEQTRKVRMTVGGRIEASFQRDIAEFGK